MKIKKIAVGELSANCYFVYDENTKDAVVIDPGDDGIVLMEFVQQQGLNIKYILNTHGHNDHCDDDFYMKAQTGALVAISEEDEIYLSNPAETDVFYRDRAPLGRADICLHDGDVINFGNCSLQVIATPGHTKGGVCFYSAEHKCCFTGDTLFRATVGRVDFYGGDMDALMHSIKEKLAFVPDDATIYPGHGAASTMGYERGMNRYLK